MKRREFMTLLGGAAAAWPLAARAQQPAKVPRVGILSPAASETAGTLTAFREGIRDLGYVEGQTVALDFRLSKGVMDALPALAAELVRIPVNVIVTDGTSATLAAFDATRTIPIVMGATGGDPVALGLAKSLSRPGGNVTGTQLLTGLSQKRLQLFKQAFPGAKCIAVLANPKDAIDVAGSLVEMLGYIGPIGDEPSIIGVFPLRINGGDVSLRCKVDDCRAIVPEHCVRHNEETAAT